MRLLFPSLEARLALGALSGCVVRRLNLGASILLEAAGLGEPLPDDAPDLGEMVEAGTAPPLDDAEAADGEGGEGEAADSGGGGGGGDAAVRLHT